MTSETALWHWVKGHVCPGFLHRIENSIDEGTPDVYYCIDGDQGWIELKQIKKWPTYENTPVKIKHFTIAQRQWLWMHALHGGRSFLWLRVGSLEHLIFKGNDVEGVGVMLNKEQLIERCALHLTGRFTGLVLSKITTLLGS